MIVEPALQQFFSHQAPLGCGEPIVVAFSGGPDSLGLAFGLKRLATRGRGRPILCHVDHQMDADSGSRAQRARAIATELGLQCYVQDCSIDPVAKSRWGPEAAARQARYAALETCRREIGARWIATAHHRDDQVETALMRLMFGSGLHGLAAMSSRRDHLVRPLLGVSRAELQQFTSRCGIEAIQDPTNLELSTPRNYIRLALLPALEASHPGLRRDISRLAEISRSLYQRFEREIRSRITPTQVDGDAALARSQLEALPDALVPVALVLLHRSAGLPYPPRAAAVGDLLRQMRGGFRIGCDCGDQWRWQQRGDYLTLCRIQPPAPRFAYTLQVPGDCEVPELSMRFRIRQGPVASWMFRQSELRAALDLPLVDGDTVLVRNRRPGDRLTPLGCAYSKRLKDVLIDRQVPRERRSRLPLLFVDRRLAWVPGVTIAEPYRLTSKPTAWIAELETT